VADKNVPLVIQLQQAAMDESVSASSLLLKAKLVASKLGLADSEMAQWIRHELDGYAGAGADLPSCRLLTVEPFAINPFRGEIPVQVGHPAPEALLKALYELPFTNPVGEIEALIAKGETSGLRVPFPSELQHLVSQLSGNSFPLRWRLGPGVLAAILQAVRTRTMEWALQLEAGGVLGEDFNFTLTEKATAMTITNNITNSNVGTLGDVTGGSQVTNNQTISNVVAIDKLAAFLDQLRPAIPNLPADIQASLEEPVAVLSHEVEAKEPSQSKIRAALTSVKTTCEGAAGNLIASGVLGLVGPLLG
jgi:hypothetical protein